MEINGLKMFRQVLDLEPEGEDVRVKENEKMLPSNKYLIAVINNPSP